MKKKLMKSSNLNYKKNISHQMCVLHPTTVERDPLLE